MNLTIDPIYPAIALAYFAALALCAITAWILSRQEQAVRARWTTSLLVLVVVFSTLAYGFARYPDSDEIEHLHDSWLIYQGQTPFTDFWEHHSPTLWILLSPVVGNLPHSGLMCDFARALSLLVSIVAWLLAIRLASRLHGPSRGLTLVMWLLWAGSIIPGEFNNLRPDLFADVFSMGAVLILVVSRRPVDVLASGALLGFALSFTPKHAPLALMLPLTVLLEQRRILPFLKSTVIQFVGVAIGLAPLAAWLVGRGLLDDYWRWVIVFNRNEGVTLGGTFPLVPLVLAAAWALRIRTDRWDNARPADRIVLVGILLSIAILFLYKTSAKATYHLQMFLLLASAAGSFEAKTVLAALAKAGRAWIAGLLIGLSFASSLLAWQWLWDVDYIAGRTEIGRTMEIARGRPVVAIPPRHPITAPDATDLSQAWQWWVYLSRPEIRARLKGMGDKIIETRPVLIGAGEPPSTTGDPKTEAVGLPALFVQQLCRNQVIGIEETRRLQKFLLENYRLFRIGRHWYWVLKE